MEVNRLAARPVAWLAAGAAVLAVCGGPAAAVVTPAASVLGLPGAAGRSSVAASGTGRAGQIASRALVRRGVWGKAQLVRGAETGQSAVLSVSCASPGNCSAGGYLTQGESVQAMVLSQRNGAWGKAEVVPGTVPLNTGGQAEVTSVSCASPGNCSAVGTYTTPALVYASPQQVFVVTEHNGTWGQAEEVPGLGALNTGAEAQISAVSCGAAGNCVAGGWYLSGSPTGSSTSVPFVVSQRNGRWGKAQQLPGLTGGVGEVNSVSCGAKDSCVAGGYFGRYHVRPVFNAFVAVQKGGRWDRALPVRMYEVSSVSCASAGNCTAADSTDFAVSQRHGRWGKPEKIPGLTDDTLIESLSCAAPGDCAVGGSARIGSVDGGFVAVQHNGIWGKAEPVPGLAALNTGRFSYVMSVSCRAAGNCSAGGYGGYAFVVSQATRPAARPSHL